MNDAPTTTAPRRASLRRPGRLLAPAVLVGAVVVMTLLGSAEPLPYTYELVPEGSDIPCDRFEAEDPSGGFWHAGPNPSASPVADGTSGLIFRSGDVGRFVTDDGVAYPVQLDETRHGCANEDAGDQGGA